MGGVLFMLCLTGFPLWIRDSWKHRRVMRELSRTQAEKIVVMRAARGGNRNLGTLVHVFGNQPPPRPVKSSIRVSVISAAVLVATVGAMAWDLTPSSSGHVVPIGGFASVAGLAFTVMAFSTRNVVRYRRHRDEQFQLYQGGFVHVDARGTRSIPWDDIDAVNYNFSEGEWGPAAKVRIRDGSRIGIPRTIQHARNLVDLISGAVYRGHYPGQATTSGD
ncbi:hypothetical protein ACFWY5_49235 [Nonomuraea sp. NPDC059007]|uniref:hypothetical protein n=1 Tax=Nonomuraea sp. NPDC059007 TaxID=3346692 RepID=UPI003681698E